MELSLLSVFLLGLLGGLHCAGMCGGIVGVLGASAARPATAARRVIAVQPVPTGPMGGPVPVAAAGGAACAMRTATRWPMLLAYNAGRIASYVAAGAIAGALGSVAMLAERVLPVAQVAFVGANLVLIAMGAYLLGAWRSLAAIEALGRRAWTRLQPLAARTLRAERVPQAFAAGLVWGWVPCGMVYGVLVAAVLAGDPRRGALLMAAFGVGTLPNLLALGWSAARLRALWQRPAWRAVAGVVVIAFGVAGLARVDPFAHLHAVVDACITAWSR